MDKLVYKPLEPLSKLEIQKQMENGKEDEWSVECNYSVLNESSVEKKKAKMYVGDERRWSEWTQKYLVHL